MRNLAFLVNLALFTGLILLLLTNTGERPNPGQLLIILLVLAVPIINFLALADSSKEKDVFSLYFERKKLEQQKRINELKKSIGGDI